MEKELGCTEQILPPRRIIQHLSLCLWPAYVMHTPHKTRRYTNQTIFPEGLSSRVETHATPISESRISCGKVCQWARRASLTSQKAWGVGCWTSNKRARAEQKKSKELLILAPYGYQAFPSDQLLIVRHQICILMFIASRLLGRCFLLQVELLWWQLIHIRSMRCRVSPPQYIAWFFSKMRFACTQHKSRYEISFRSAWFVTGKSEC